MIEVKPIYWYKLAPLGDRIVTRIDPRGQPNEKEFSPLYDQSAIDALQARIAELEKDAGRYRWLRDEGQFWGQLQILFDRREPNEWDRHIDETRASIDASVDKAYDRFEAALGKNDAAIAKENSNG